MLSLNRRLAGLYTGAKENLMAEDKKPVESPKPERPEGRKFPPPGPERIVKLSAGVDRP